MSAALRAFYGAAPAALAPAPDPTLTLLHGLLAMGSADPEYGWDVSFDPGTA